MREQTSLPARERTLPVVVVACCLPGVVPALARPDFKAVSHFDTAVDNFFEAHLRGRPALDRVMYAASAVGDHSAIWLALAALQGWRSGSGWRPLLRVGALLGAESALVNGLVKLAFHRERPESTEEREALCEGVRISGSVAPRWGVKMLNQTLTTALCLLQKPRKASR